MVGAALLELRSQRQHLHREVTQLHVEIDQARHRTWDAQVRIAERAAPGELRAVLERVGLELKPAVPGELQRPVTLEDQMVDREGMRHW